MNTRMVRRAALAAVILIVSFARGENVPATQPAAQPVLEWKTERVVIFKDGYGLVVKSGHGVADGQGHAITYDVPDAAVLGCFWATSLGEEGDGDGQTILGMCAEWHETKERRQRETACTSIVEVLRANVGKTLTLELGVKNAAGEPTVQHGKLVDVLDVPADDPMVAGDAGVGALPTRLRFASSRALPSGSAAYTTLIREGQVTPGSFNPDAIAGGGTIVRELVPQGGQFLVLEQEGEQRRVLPVSAVTAVRGGKEIVTTMTREQEVLSRSKRLRFDFGAASAGKPVSLRLF